MRTYWSETRANGAPLEPGTVCLVSDPEDGSHPIYTYGTDKDDAYNKIAMNNLHARAALDRISNPPAPRTTPPTTAPAMTADEIMQATAELADPARSGSASARLLKDATGVDLNQLAMDNWLKLAKDWEDETPEFYPHPGNRTLLGRAAGIRVNGRVGLITKQMLDECFEDARRQGLIFEVPEGSERTEPPAPSNLETFPDATQVRRVERPRGARFATGIPGSRLGAPQQIAPTKTLKYTKEQIDRMSLDKSRYLIQENDRDYAEACEFFYPTKSKASA